MNSEKEREAFEAYCQSIGFTLKTGDSGHYLGGYGAELWAGFKVGAAYQRAQQPSTGVVMPLIPYKPELSDADLTDYEKGRLQGRCDMWAEFARLNGKEVGRGNE